MTTSSSVRGQARFAGLLYALMAALGIWAELYVRARVHVPGDAATTAARLAEHDTLVRWGLAADLAMSTVFVLLGLAFQRLFHPVSSRHATALLVLVAGGATSMLAKLTFQAGALTVNDADLALLMLDLHHDAYVIGGILFGLWLLPLGQLLRLSADFPSWLGVIVLVGGVAWLADPVLAFVLPESLGLLRDLIAVPTSVAEFGLILYLLIRGSRS